MRDKGLCYYCNAKWSPGHKCQKEVLLEKELGEVVEEEVCEKREETTTLDLCTTQGNLEISLHTLTRSHNQRSISVKMRIGHSESPS